jgi:hypothetical protein
VAGCALVAATSASASNGTTIPRDKVRISVTLANWTGNPITLERPTALRGQIVLIPPGNPETIKLGYRGWAERTAEGARRGQGPLAAIQLRAIIPQVAYRERAIVTLTASLFFPDAEAGLQTDSTCVVEAGGRASRSYVCVRERVPTTQHRDRGTRQHWYVRPR